jgi:ADP-ribose pyrophosphatase YjhB (NUDIX family)
MHEARYCYICGSRLAVGVPPGEDRERLVCSGCGYVHYLNPKVVCGTLPVEAGRVWLLRRGIEPRMGYWTYPAGFQELDETTEEGAIRETLEELGCSVTIEALFGVYSHPHAPVNIVYVASLLPDAVPHLTPEATEVRAFGPNEVPWEELAFVSTHDILRDWVKAAQNAAAR